MEFLAQYNLTGIVIGIATFLIIGIFHPMVTKGEYYFGVKIWWLFLVMGIAAVAGSIAVRHILWSTLLAVWGASSFMACPPYLMTTVLPVMFLIQGRASTSTSAAL